MYRRCIVLLLLLGAGVEVTAQVPELRQQLQDVEMALLELVRQVWVEPPAERAGKLELRDEDLDLLQPALQRLEGAEESGGAAGRQLGEWVRRELDRIQERERRQKGQMIDLRGHLQRLREELEREPRPPGCGAGQDLLQRLRLEGEGGEASGQLEEILDRPVYRSRREEAQRQQETVEGDEDADGTGSEAGLRRDRQPVRRVGPLRDGLDPREAPEREMPDWLSRLGQWSGPSARSVRILIWCLAGVVLALLLFFILRGLRGYQARRFGNALHEEEHAATARAISLGDITAMSPEEFSATASSLARQARYREAIRALYLELLSRLYHCGAITFDRTRTNWEYAAQLRARPELREPFLILTEVFDRIWYGQQESAQGDYLHCREQVLDVVQHLPMG